MTPPAEGPRGGRPVAWAAFAFGSVISIAGNVLYTWIPPRPDNAGPDWVAPAAWSPTLTAQLFAAVWPVALLLSVEVLSRVQWAPGWQWMLVRYLGAGTVALGSAVISYGHLSAVLASWGYGTVGSGVGPIVLDGLMAVSGFALLSPAALPASPTVEDAEPPADTSDESPAVGLHSVPSPTPTGDVRDPVAELVAAGAGWRKVQEATGLSEHHAKKAIREHRNGSGP